MAGRRPSNPPGRSNPSGFSSVAARSSGKCPDCLHWPKGKPKDHVHVQCPDCLDRNALRIDGRVITEGGELRPATKSAGRKRLSAGCENCKGTGQVANHKMTDPYFGPLSADQAARLAKSRRVTPGSTRR